MSVRTFLDKSVNSNEMSRDNADCIYNEYLVLRDDYLAGKLDKSALETMQKLRIELEKNQISEPEDLPDIENTVLLTIAKAICKKAKST